MKAHNVMVNKKIVITLLSLITLPVMAEPEPIYNQRYIAKLLHRLPKEQKFVAITFDDGPSKLTTPVILKTLETYEAKATFFIVGQQAYRNGHLVDKIIKAGHEIGNHTYSHASLTRQTLPVVLAELQKTQAVLLQHSEHVQWFRPPYGAYNSKIHGKAAELGLNTVLWSVDSRDWKACKKELLVSRVLKDIKPGSIVLFHDTKSNTVEALPEILKALKNEHYEFLTMTEWQTRVETLKMPASQQLLKSSDIAQNEVILP